MGVKISDLTSLATSTFADDDIMEIEQYVSVGVYQTRKMTGAQIREAIQDLCSEYRTIYSGLDNIAVE